MRFLQAISPRVWVEILISIIGLQSGLPEVVELESVEAGD